MREQPEIGVRVLTKHRFDSDEYESWLRHLWVKLSSSVTHDESLDDGPVVMATKWICHCGAMKEVDYLVQKPSGKWKRSKELVSA